MGITKKPAKGRKKTKTKTVRKDGSVRTTQAAAKKIKDIAQRIFDKDPEKCRKAGYNKPSAKLAIDYLIMADMAAYRMLSDEEAKKDNEYYRMRSIDTGDE